jgi:5-methylcytosine-specific restriction enzyme A
MNDDIKNLIQRCLDSNFTQKRIAVLMGCSQSYVSTVIKKFNIKPCGLTQSIDRQEELRLYQKNKPYYKKEGREVIREKVRIRDNYTCQLCKREWKITERSFDVHHKDNDAEKTMEYGNYERDKDNLITLCHKCHLSLPQHRKKMRYRKSWIIT